MKKSLVLILTLVTAVSLVVAFSSCRELFTGEETTHYSGDILTPEEIESIFAAVSDTETEKYPTDTDSDGELIVYWLKGGTVWHVSKNCSSIQKSASENILCGSTDDAVAAGKSRACKICSAGKELEDDTDITTETSHIEAGEETVRYPKKYDSQGALIVYWLDGGSVWHESDQCPSVMRADPSSVRSGTVNDAYYKGKERACKVCSADSTETPDKSDSNEVADATTERQLKESDTAVDLSVSVTQSGSVWHECGSCSGLSNTADDSIYGEMFSKAVEQGKRRV
ncbi:MAG: hypothetical protein ACI3XI_00215 [Eubacteriales bacterium]